MKADLEQGTKELNNAIKRREAAIAAEEAAKERIEKAKGDLQTTEVMLPELESSYEALVELEKQVKSELRAHRSYVEETGFETAMQEKELAKKEAEKAKEEEVSSSNSQMDSKPMVVRAKLEQEIVGDVPEFKQRAEVERIKAMMKLMRRDLSKVEKPDVVYTGFRDFWVVEEKKDEGEDQEKKEITPQEADRLRKIHYRALEQLQALGYTDETQQLELLVEHNGDFEKVLAKLLDFEWQNDREEEEYLVL
eukprot:TRINITY_DN1259_c0_g1_i3.p1 TRINITY_DN1259_c0_g1~~TRINITY_DN1259_c0_g1_i3.p1  ORF type:complete len:251 (-),score=130.77 TRINITY_DN1259_c0_g1_i3:81-833(-)